MYPMSAMKLLDSPVNPGDHLDHYRINRAVADSNEATVFQATDLRHGSQVAIKIPHPEMESDPTFADRFNRELEIGERLFRDGFLGGSVRRSGLYGRTNCLWRAISTWRCKAPTKRVDHP
jgi:serine/threonine protein kinase